MMKHTFIRNIITFIILTVLIVGISSATVSQYNLSNGGYNIKIFNGTGTVNFTMPVGITSFQYIIIAGGGAGGSDNAGNAGGGGAGGLLQGNMTVAGGDQINITVGAGGTYVDNQWGNNGVNSSLSNSSLTLTAIGGGGGGTYAASFYNGRNGGSGGGAAQWAGALQVGGTGSQGSNGASAAGSGQTGGSGGGGYGEAGSASTNTGGKGGNGTQSNITGILTWYAGGGAGGSHSSSGSNGGGGLGGGGTGHYLSNASTAGTDGLGGGGGGGGESTNGANGGSGTVIIKYVATSPVASFISNATQGFTQLPVQFNDTSVSTPISWNWSFINITPGNNTEVWWSQIQNATNIFGIGNWNIHLNVSNESGYNVSTANYWINVSDTVSPISSFTSNVSNGLPMLVVQFNDTSIHIPSTWNWSYRNATGNDTEIWFSTLQNPTFSFGIGNWSIKLNSSNVYGFNITPVDFWINVSVFNPCSPYSSTVSGGDTVLIFNNTIGSCNWSAPDKDAWIVIIGGGASGSHGFTGLDIGAGGGAGGLLNGTLSANGAYEITIGSGGGPKAVTGYGNDGSSTIFKNNSLTFTAIGGGGGAVGAGGGTSAIGSTGGSGGGGYSTGAGGTGNQTSQSPLTGYGHNGGTGIAGHGAGGGGAMADGASATPSGNAVGFTSSITGASLNYSTGGASQSTNNGTNYGDGGGAMDNYGYAGQNGSIIIRYTGSPAPTVSFISNITSGFAPLPVQFNDTSIINPIDWNWSFTNITPGNNTEVWWSQVQNATNTFGVGNWSIRLNVTNASSFNISSSNTFWINVTPTPQAPIALFTADVFNGTPPLMVQFNDTSLYTPTSWNWSFRDVTGNNTVIWWSQVQNATLSFLTPGNYSIVLNATNLIGSNLSTQAMFVNISQVAAPPSPNLTLDGEQIFPLNNIWNVKINTLPVDANSSLYVTGGGNANPNAYLYIYDDFPINVVNSSNVTAKAPLSCEYPIYCDAGLYPFPDNALKELGSSDNHSFVFDIQTKLFYEVYHFQQYPNGSFTFGTSVIYNASNNSISWQPRVTADAAGLPMLPGLLRAHEVVDEGVIPHALRFCMNDLRGDYVWPARGAGGSENDSLALAPHGERFRLKASYDISGYNADEQVVLIALKEYGMILADWNGGYDGSFHLTAEPNTTWEIDGSSFSALRLTDFEAVNVSDIMVDEDSGETSFSDIYNQTISGFTANITTGTVPLSVRFNVTNPIDNATQWNWSFGDGAWQNGTTQNVSHVYTISGTYTIIEIASNPSYTNTTTRTNYLTFSVPYNQTISGFTLNVSSGVVPLAVGFNVTNPIDNATQWNWSFGDGTWQNGTTQNVSHVYTTTGTFEIIEIASNSGTSNTTIRYPKIERIVNGGFETGTFFGWNNSTSTSVNTNYPHSGTYSALIPSLTFVNQTLNFTNTTTLLYWARNTFEEEETNFRVYIDGTLLVAHSLSPNWIYYSENVSSYTGIHTINFSMFNPAFSAAVDDISIIATPEDPVLTVYNTITSGFTANVTIGSELLHVGFNVTNPNDNATMWNWSFGDGTWQNGTTQNVSHIYSNGGIYTVTEITSNPFSTTSTTLLNYILVYNQTFNSVVGNNTFGYIPLPVEFNSTSNNATMWNWSFGDGTWFNATNGSNVTHVFSIAQNNTVNLTTSDHGFGLCTTRIYIDTIFYAPSASFSAFPTSGSVPLFVTFTDQSLNGPTQWNWSFGDNLYSSLQNPNHTYSNIGTYTVMLNVSNIYGSSNSSVNITVFAAQPISSFTINPNVGAAPLSVTFTDTSIGGCITNWQWNFGDGEIDINQNPTHVYNSIGTYQATLIVSNDIGSNLSQPVSIYVVSGPVPIVDFNASPTSGSDPLDVQFTDLSVALNGITGWNWSFGDGNFSNTQNPLHTYTSVGQYSITLSVTESGNFSNYTKNAFINVGILSNSISVNYTGIIIGSNIAPASVQFTDYSVCNPVCTNWYWDFNNDGQVDSVAQNPLFVYTYPGNYSPKLIVSNGINSGTLIRNSYISIGPIFVPTTIPQPTASWVPGYQQNGTSYIFNGPASIDLANSTYLKYWLQNFTTSGNFSIYGFATGLMAPIMHVFGFWIFLIIWGLYLFAVWIRTQDVTMPLIIGILTIGTFGLLFPKESLPVIIIMFVICGAIIVTKLMKDSI